MSEMRSLAVAVLLLHVGGVALAFERPVAVSPGDVSKLALSGDACPTFSWGGVPRAKSYELVVYRLGDAGEEAQPVLRETFAGSVSSWTPSLDRCLERGGKYAWSVRAGDKKEASDWSAPKLFEVAAGPSEAEFEEALAVVERYLNDTEAETRAREVPEEKRVEELVVEGGLRMGGFSSPGPAAASSQEVGNTLIVDGRILAYRLREECGTGVRRWGVNGHCYFWVSIKPGVSWERFGLYCAQYGAYLATLTSTYEETFVRTMFDPPHSPLGRAWIGYSDARSEGTWEWVTGELAVTGNDTTYANWATGEPNDSNGEDCAEMIPGGWNDEDCSYEQIEYAVCERDH